jgi:hypothetical protein
MSREPNLTEAVGSVAGRVDRAAGVIHGVKVLGLQSANGRTYLPEAIRSAAPLYEHKSVRANHPKKADDQRDVEEVFGWLEGCRLDEHGELYADLHILNPTSELAESVFQAAERNPKLFGLSHNADGEVQRVDGRDVVTRIVEVRSVDLVADPATTRGLFEGKRAEPMKLKAFFEALRLRPKQRKLVRRLFEVGMMKPDQDMEEAAPPPADAPPADHEQALSDGFRAACQGVLDDEGMSADDKVGRIKELLKAHEKLKGGGEAGAEEEGLPEEEGEDEEELMDQEGEGEGEEVEECKEGEDEDEKMKEARNLRRELVRLRAREHCRLLCEAADVRPSKVLLAALTALRSEADRQALIEEAQARPGKGSKPRSGAGAGRGETPSQAGDLDSFIIKLRGG